MKAEVIAQASELAQVDCNPVIAAEIFAIVDRHQRAKIYTVSTAYNYGDVVQLAVRNGHRYMATAAGTSAATAPTFPARNGSGLTDGNDLTWVEIGPDYENVYDIRAILHEAWMLKAAKSSHLVTTSAGNSRVEASALQAQCRERARDFAPVGIA